MSNQFNVTLLSNDSINIYPKNVLSSFTNYIQCPLNFDGRWEVGISEFFYNGFTTVLDSYLNGEIIDANLANKFHMMQSEYFCEINDVEPATFREVVQKKNQHSDLMYIHTDIITPRIVGDQMVRCLKVLPASGRNQEYVKFGRIEYYSVEPVHVRSISVCILDAEANKINFNYSLLPTMITLHFRKINI